ncbi:MAG TPA: CsbD family protein [Acidimicrobiales bacterium]
MSANDKVHNTAETVRGKAKETVGRVTNDDGIEFEGKAEQIAGHLKQAGEKLKDAFKSGAKAKDSRSSR